MNELFTDVGWLSLKKHGEQLCGDQVCVVEPDGRSVVMVLADGLGSGVKACILSTLTAKIISTMMARSMGIEDCVATIAATLPVCAERHIAYSTFTIMKVTDNREAEIIQYDNPDAILLRSGKNLDLPLSCLEIGGKRICRTKVKLEEGDLFVCLSDGVLHAGTGEALNMDWQRRDIVSFMEEKCASGIGAKAAATILLDQCSRLYQGKPSDDATVCAVKVRSRLPVNLMIGPPLHPSDDHKMLSLFFSKEGRHIVCGGTTAEITGRFLDRTVEAVPLCPDPSIPPISRIDGVDLATEGLVTLTRVVEYARNRLEDNSRYFEWICKLDGASRLAWILFEEATDINLFVGGAVNPANQNQNLGLDFNSKMRLVEELARCLKKMGKRIKVSYF